jgi:hypothetical protein
MTMPSSITTVPESAPDGLASFSIPQLTYRLYSMLIFLLLVASGLIYG